MEIKTLLFVTKFQELCFDALQSLLALTNASLEHVVFLNVIEREKVAMKRGAGYDKEEAVKLREMANIRFIDWAENLFEMGLEVGAYMEVGQLIPSILKAVDKEKPDLIVIGRPHKGPLESLYSKSDVIELVRRASVPVLVFKHMTDDNLVPEKLFERPLLSTNWSPVSLKATEVLKGMKDVVDEVHVMHVLDEKQLKSSSTLDVQTARKKIRKKLDELCAEFDAIGVDAKPHVYVGDPVKEIEKAAREYQASMVILGSSSKGSLVERWTGSIPQSLSDKSVFPCLIIPDDKK